MLDTGGSTVEEGLEKLQKAVNTRDKMGGAMYYNICNDVCCEIANRLCAIGADKSKIEGILKTGYYKLKGEANG